MIIAFNQAWFTVHPPTWLKHHPGNCSVFNDSAHLAVSSWPRRLAFNVHLLCFTMTEKTYYESAKGQRIGRARAIKEVESHGGYVQDFLAELGTKESYDAQSVLRWLGY